MIGRKPSAATHYLHRDRSDWVFTVSTRIAHDTPRRPRGHKLASFTSTRPPAAVICASSGAGSHAASSRPDFSADSRYAALIVAFPGPLSGTLFCFSHQSRATSWALPAGAATRAWTSWRASQRAFPSAFPSPMSATDHYRVRKARVFWRIFTREPPMSRFGIGSRLPRGADLMYGSCGA